MTKPLDAEIKALRGVVRALEPLDARTRQRALEWYVAQRLPLFRSPSGKERGE